MTADDLFALQRAKAEAARKLGEAMRNHPRSCMWCVSFSPEDRWCELWTGRVPDDFIPGGCGDFEELIPF